MPIRFCPAAPYLRLLSLMFVGLLCAACAARIVSVPTDGPMPRTASGQQLERAVVDLQARRFVPFEAMVAAVADAQVVIVGEEHDHLPIQAMVLHLLRSLGEQRPQHLALAMEFLERDMQPEVDAYIVGETDRATFHKRIKAQPSFMRLYSPLVYHARQHRMPVLAINVPRRLAQQVRKEGLQATMENLSVGDRAYLPVPLSFIDPAYRAYFLEAVAAFHPVDGDNATHFVEASHLKDDTMAATVAAFLNRHADFTVLTLAGRFHVDYGRAVPGLLRRRRPQTTIARIIAMPVEAREQIDLQRLAEEGIADYVWFAPPRREQDKT